MSQALSEGDKVWVTQSNCGYQGPAILVGLIFGSTWLVRALEGDEKVFSVRVEHISASVKASAPTHLSKEERKALKKKYKEERRNHQPRGDRGRR